MRVNIKRFVEARAKAGLCLLCEGQERSLGLCNRCYQQHRLTMLSLTEKGRARARRQLIAEGKLRDSRQGMRPPAQQTVYTRLAETRGMNPLAKAI